MKEFRTEEIERTLLLLIEEALRRGASGFGARDRASSAARRSALRRTISPVAPRTAAPATKGTNGSPGTSAKRAMRKATVKRAGGYFPS